MKQNPSMNGTFYFKSTSNMTTGDFAFMECLRLAGMWTQVPA
jgi:hypothetical protein